MTFIQMDEDFFKNVFLNYWGNVSFFIIYIFALIYIIKNKGGTKKYIIGYMPIVAFCTVFNPFLVSKLVEKLELMSRYYRFNWILPVALTISIVLVDIVFRCKKVFDKVIIVALIVLLVQTAGVKFGYEHDDGRDNIYKISDEVIEVSDIIHEYTNNSQVTAYYGAGLAMELRTYDASIVTPIGRYQWTMPSEEDLANAGNAEGYGSLYDAYTVLSMMTFAGVEYDVEVVHDAFKKYNIECFIRDKNKFSDEYIKSLGYKKIGETDSYEVYWCN